MLIVHEVKSMYRVNLGSACILKELEKEQYNPDRTILTLSFEKQAEKTSRKNKQKKQAEKINRIKQLRISRK